MAADPLSDVLKTVRLTGAMFFEIAGKAPWVAESPPREMAPPEDPAGCRAPDRLSCGDRGPVLRRPRRRGAGDGRRGRSHRLHELRPACDVERPGHARRDRPIWACCEAATANQLPFFLTLNGDAAGPATNLVCGYPRLRCPAVQSAPPEPAAGDQGRRPGDTGWLRQFIRFAMMEAGEKRAGGESVLAKLSELMFIEVVRRHLESMPPEQAGWLAGLRDPCVGKALSAMHRKPADDWTIEALARQVGVSRSVLTSASPSWSACRRCSTSPSGGCRSRQGS